MFIICGLGNPGERYLNTRHNVGFDLIEKIIKKFDFELLKKDKKKEIYTGLIDKKKCLIIKPLTFMNLSGIPIKELLNFYKINKFKLYVIHDDLDLPPGVSKLKFSGGDGGHNGLKDIMQSLSGKKDFKRLRIGIGHPGDTKKVNSFVVKKGPSSDRKNKLLAMHNALEVFELVAFDDWEKALTQLHSKK